MEQENFKVKEMIAEKKAMESTIKDMLELFVIKYDVQEDFGNESYNGL